MQLLFRIAGLSMMGALLAGCGVLPIPLPTTVATSPTPTAAPLPSEATTSPSASPLDAAGAIDVSQYGLNGFASPSGNTVCSIGVDGARCDLPDDFTGTSPSEDEVCPDSELVVAGAAVIDQAEWVCAGDPAAFPSPDSEETTWWKKTGFPTVKRDGSTWVTLPVGQKLIAGDFLCLSTQTGITCGNLPIDTGFTVTRSAVTLF